MQAARLEGHAQRLPGAEQVVLADHLVELRGRSRSASGASGDGAAGRGSGRPASNSESCALMASLCQRAQRPPLTAGSRRRPRAA